MTLELGGRGVDAVVGNLELTGRDELALLLSPGRFELSVLTLGLPMEFVAVDCEPKIVSGLEGKGLLLALDCDELGGSGVTEVFGADGLPPLLTLELSDPPGWS